MRRIPLLRTGLIVAAGFGFFAVAQVQQPNVIRNFRQPTYYEGADFGRTNMIITGKEAEPLATGGRLRIKELQINTYRRTGELELMIEAPNCLFTLAGSEVSSDGPIKVRSADGRLTIEGTGFQTDTNSMFVISNNVVTTIRKDFFNQPSPAGAATNAQTAEDQFIRIRSDSLRYDRNFDLAVFSNNVHASDSQLELSSEVINVRRSTNGTIQDISAERNVVITDKESGGTATGTHAVYTGSEGAQLVTLTGEPSWRDGTREATAKSFVYDRLNRTFQADGDARMKMPRESLMASDSLLAPQSGAAPTNNAPSTNLVELQAESIRLKSRPGSGAIEDFLAQKNVVILDPAGTNHATAARAAYSVTNGVLELTGDAVWEAGQRVARGGLLAFNRTNQTFVARTNAYLKVPLAALSTSLGPESAGAKHLGASTNLFLEVTSADYEFENEVLTFHDRVKANLFDGDSHRAVLECARLTASFRGRLLQGLLAETNVHTHQLPFTGLTGRTVERDLTCERLEVFFRTNASLERFMAEGGVAAWELTTFTNGAAPVRLTGNAATLDATFLPNLNEVDTAIAQDRVVFIRNDDKLRGAKVVYTGTNHTAVMTGRPVWERMSDSLTADMFIYNQSNGVIQATGRPVAVFLLPSSPTNPAAQRKDPP